MVKPNRLAHSRPGAEDLEDDQPKDAADLRRRSPRAPSRGLLLVSVGWRLEAREKRK